MKRVISLILASLMIASFAACGSDTSSDTAETTASQNDAADTTAAVTEETEPSRENTPDNLPALNFEGDTIKLYCRGHQDHITYEMGPTEETGEIVADAIYERNRLVEERLNAKIVIEYGPAESGPYSTSYYNLVLAGDHVYDIAAGIKYSHEGIFTNLADAPYLDFDADWWNYEYMKEVAVDANNIYMLVGDLSLFSLRNLSAMFYNKSLYGSLYGNGDALYDTVLDGDWTHELFRKMVTEAYQDTNGDGAVDLGDVLGSSGNLATKADHYSYPAGIRMTERNSDGLPVLVEDQSNNIAVMEALNQLYYHT